MNDAMNGRALRQAAISAALAATLAAAGTGGAEYAIAASLPTAAGPAGGPATSPVTSQATSPVGSLATSPATSQATSPATGSLATSPASSTANSPAGGLSGGPVGGPELARPGVIVNYPSRRVPRLPKIRAGAFMVADATTGQILAARRPHTRYAPASTLKILTAVSLIPALNPNATVVASKRAVHVEPDIVGLKRGHRYKVADLFRALLLISGNDAAVALAEATGSFGKGIALMNAEARRLRAYDTVAKQPNGLDAPGQHVSAYDEALIARCALQMPAFLKYDETLQAWFPITSRHRIQLFNQDRLLTEYRGFLGGKTGWTTPAMAAYVGMARRDGHTLIVTMLHAVPGTIFASATKLLNWGFRLDGKIRPVGWLVSPLPPERSRPHHSVPSAQAPHKAHVASSTRILLPLTAGCLAFAGLVFGYGITRRRHEPRRASRRGKIYR